MPASVVPESALQVCAVRAPVFLRAGAWPISPLCTPELVKFGEWMPREWRAEKRLPREWLMRMGTPHQVARPRLRENFRPVMPRALREHGMPQLRKMITDGSVLIDFGFVNSEALAKEINAAEAALSAGCPIPPELYEQLALERGLRTLLR